MLRPLEDTHEAIDRLLDAVEALPSGARKRQWSGLRAELEALIGRQRQLVLGLAVRGPWIAPALDPLSPVHRREVSALLDRLGENSADSAFVELRELLGSSFSAMERLAADCPREAREDSSRAG